MAIMNLIYVNVLLGFCLLFSLDLPSLFHFVPFFTIDAVAPIRAADFVDLQHSVVSNAQQC